MTTRGGLPRQVARAALLVGLCGGLGLATAGCSGSSDREAIQLPSDVQLPQPGLPVSGIRCDALDAFRLRLQETESARPADRAAAVAALQDAATSASARAPEVAADISTLADAAGGPAAGVAAVPAARREQARAALATYIGQNCPAPLLGPAAPVRRR